MQMKIEVGEEVFLVIMTIYFVLLLSTFQCCCSAARQHQKSKNSLESPAANRFGPSVIFPIDGNVYPKGYYHVTLNIGSPPKPYFLDIDTGSDLTWLQCDAPCTKCNPAPHPLYKPQNNYLITCEDPLCGSLHWSGDHRCTNPKEQCDYEVEYADHGSSMGVLIRDSFHLRFTNGSIAGPLLAFGCGYNQQVPDSVLPPFTDGVLGLGNGKSSIVSQLYELGNIKNVIGHCFSASGGGFLFFGNDLVPPSGIVWTSLLRDSLEKHYSLGHAELLFGRQTTGLKGLPIVIDSGSTYTYFNDQAYKALISMINKDMSGIQLKDAIEDKSLPVCWKGAKPFKSINDLKNLFKPLVLSFKKTKNIQLQLPPEAYLIVTEHGNACLGILNGTEVGLGSFNVIGDISLQDKMVIYDNEKQQIGWTPTNCDRLPNIDRDYEDFPYLANMRILDEYSETN